MAPEFDHQICPSCNGEFTLAVERCSECDVDLVPPDAVAEDEFPPATELHCVRVAPIAWIEALSEGLEERDVPHRVEPVAADAIPEGVEAVGTGELVGLFVDDAGLAIAREIDRSIAARVLPAQHADELAEGEVESCPACGEELSADAQECPECGLAFGG